MCEPLDLAEARRELTKALFGTLTVAFAHVSEDDPPGCSLLLSSNDILRYYGDPEIIDLMHSMIEAEGADRQ